jgi:hypothetical protein
MEKASVKPERSFEPTSKSLKCASPRPNIPPMLAPMYGFTLLTNSQSQRVVTKKPWPALAQSFGTASLRWPPFSRNPIR